MIDRSMEKIEQHPEYMISGRLNAAGLKIRDVLRVRIEENDGTGRCGSHFWSEVIVGFR